jgi:hypothetical protein
LSADKFSHFDKMLKAVSLLADDTAFIKKGNIKLVAYMFKQIACQTYISPY